MPDHNERLKTALALLGFDDDAQLTTPQLKQVLACLHMGTHKQVQSFNSAALALQAVLEAGETPSDEAMPAPLNSIVLADKLSDPASVFSVMEVGMALDDACGTLQQWVQSSQRAFVLLTLEEAQHLRAAIQDQQRGVFTGLPPSAHLALRAPGLIGGKAIDKTRNFERSPHGYQALAAEQMLRFADSEANNYTVRQLCLLADMLSLRTKPDARREWWERIVSCRRRKPMSLAEKRSTATDWRELTIGRLFVSMSQLRGMLLEEACRAIRAGLDRRGILMSDAFIRWDQSAGMDQSRLSSVMHSQTGQASRQCVRLRADEMKNGLLQLGTLNDAQVSRIVKAVDPNRTLQCTLESAEKLVYGGVQTKVLGANEAVPVTHNQRTVDLMDFDDAPDPQKPGPRAPVQAAPTVNVQMSTKRDARFKLQVVRGTPPSPPDHIWSSTGLAVPHPFSIFRPKLEVEKKHKKGWFGSATKSSTKTEADLKDYKVWFGDVMVEGMSWPSNKALSYLHVTDNETHGDAMSMLMNVMQSSAAPVQARKEFIGWVETAMPSPIAFRLMWSERRGQKPLFVWRPVAPPYCKALGAVCTTEPTEPRPSDPAFAGLRCLPTEWVERRGDARPFWQEYVF